MDSAIDMANGSAALDLSRIRFQLIRLEDTITFHVIERVQFALNKTIYTPGAIRIPNSDLSFFDWYFSEQERLQSLIRRYESPDEYPFFPQAVQKPILKPLNYPKILHPNSVNVNAKIKSFYIDKFLPAVCPDFGRQDRGESQENYGSAATCDFACLQALSRRIHYGKFVAESKFRSDPEKYTRLIRAGDRQGIADSITNAAVERAVLERLRLKVLTYGKEPSVSDGESNFALSCVKAVWNGLRLKAMAYEKDPSAPDGTEMQTKINVDAVVAMYKDFVIPLTKEVEVEYLMQRLGD